MEGGYEAYWDGGDERHDFLSCFSVLEVVYLRRLCFGTGRGWGLSHETEGPQRLYIFPQTSEWVPHSLNQLNFRAGVYGVKGSPPSSEAPQDSVGSHPRRRGGTEKDNLHVTARLQATPRFRRAERHHRFIAQLYQCKRPSIAHLLPKHTHDACVCSIPILT